MILELHFIDIIYQKDNTYKYYILISDCVVLGKLLTLFVTFTSYYRQ